MAVKSLLTIAALNLARVSDSCTCLSREFHNIIPLAKGDLLTTRSLVLPILNLTLLSALVLGFSVTIMFFATLDNLKRCNKSCISLLCTSNLQLHCMCKSSVVMSWGFRILRVDLRPLFCIVCILLMSRQLALSNIKLQYSSVGKMSNSCHKQLEVSPLL